MEGKTSQFKYGNVGSAFFISKHDDQIGFQKQKNITLYISRQSEFGTCCQENKNPL